MEVEAEAEQKLERDRQNKSFPPKYSEFDPRTGYSSVIPPPRSGSGSGSGSLPYYSLPSYFQGHGFFFYANHPWGVAPRPFITPIPPPPPTPPPLPIRWIPPPPVMMGYFPNPGFPMMPARDDTVNLRGRIVRQTEYYFSDENLPNDRYLRSLMDEEGWVPVSEIASFRRIKRMTNDVTLILDALRSSNAFQVQGDRIRRRCHGGSERN